MSNINQIPLWCRECGATYEAFDDDGVCTECDTPNVLERHNFSVSVPMEGYDREEARQKFQAHLTLLIQQGVLPEGTIITWW